MWWKSPVRRCLAHLKVCMTANKAVTNDYITNQLLPHSIIQHHSITMQCLQGSDKTQDGSGVTLSPMPFSGQDGVTDLQPGDEGEHAEGGIGVLGLMEQGEHQTVSKGLDSRDCVPCSSPSRHAEV